MGSDELHIDLMSQIQLPPRWRKPQKHSCKNVAWVDSIYSAHIDAHQLWAQMVPVAINPIICVTFNVTELRHFSLPLNLHKSEHVWTQRNGNFCHFKVVCGRRLWPLTNGISIKVCVSEASDPRSDRGEVCCSGGGLHYLFAPRAFIQKPLHNIEQSGSCKSTWWGFWSLIFKKCQSEARICTSLKTAEKKPLTILTGNIFWRISLIFPLKMSFEWQEQFLKISCYSNPPNWGNIKTYFIVLQHILFHHVHSHTVEWVFPWCL